MKKVLISLIFVCVLITHIPLVQAENKVKVYMFTKNGCNACESALNYFNRLLKNDPDLFELVTLQVWSGVDKNNKWIVNKQELLDLMLSTLDKFDEDTNRLATPTIVVGDYLQVGIADIEQFYDRIVKFKKSEDYTDVVASLAKEQKINIDELKEKNGSTQGKYDIYILIGIFVFLIGGFGALILCGRKK